MTDSRPSDFGLDPDTIDEFHEMMGDDAHLLHFGDGGCTLDYRLGNAPEQVRAAALEAVTLLLGFDLLREASHIDRSLISFSQVA